MHEFYRVYGTRFDLNSGTHFDPIDYASKSQLECIQVAVNRCGQEQEHQAKNGKKTRVEASIWDDKIVFTVSTVGRKEYVIVRYAVDLTPTV